MEKITESIIVDIIEKKMAMKEGSVWIGSQNRKIPLDTSLYIIVTMSNSYVVSAAKPYLIDKNGRTYEVNEGQELEQIQIDILSRSDSSITRKKEIIMALNSIYSKQKQEQYSFKICRLPNSFINTSYAEGGSQLNRYTITFSAMTWFRKEEPLASNGGLYYDDFKTRVDDAKSIETPEGIIEFESPDIIGVELCQTRFNIFTEKPKECAIQDDSIVGKIAEETRKKAEESNLDYGSDMKTAMFYAIKHNIQLALLDKDIIDIRNEMQLIPQEEMVYLQNELVKFKDENIKKEIDENEVITRMKKDIPNVFKILVEDRNNFIASNIKKLDKTKKIIIFLGKAHVKEIERMLE